MKKRKTAGSRRRGRERATGKAVSPSDAVWQERKEGHRGENPKLINHRGTNTKRDCTVPTDVWKEFLVDAENTEPVHPWTTMSQCLPWAGHRSQHQEHSGEDGKSPLEIRQNGNRAAFGSKAEMGCGRGWGLPSSQRGLEEVREEVCGHLGKPSQSQRGDAPARAGRQ